MKRLTIQSLLVFMLMLIAFKAGSIIYESFFSSTSAEPPSDEYAPTDPLHSEDAEICRTLVEDRLSDITTPDSPQHSDAVQRITSWMEKSVLDDFSRTPEELGIDVQPIAELAIGAFSFNISSASAFSDSDNPYATVRIDAQALGIYEMYFDFENEAKRYLRDIGLSVYTNDGALSNEQKAQLRSFYDKAFSSKKTDMAFVTIKLAKEDGSWVLDENEFSDGFHQLFLLPG